MSGIARYRVENFRGIAGGIEVDLTDPRTGRPTSLLLAGDNGAGKSSLVDGLEFCLRGRLSRRGVGGAKAKREVRNLAGRLPPGVLIELEDGQAFRRGGGLKQSGVPVAARGPVEGYGLSPIVIRRHDIEAFWTVSAEDRQAFFFDYLGQDSPGAPGPQAEARIRQTAEEAKSSYDKAVRQLLDLTDLQRKDLPRSLKATESFYARVLKPRYGRSRGQRIIVPRGIQKAFDGFRTARAEWTMANGAVQSLPQASPAIADQLAEMLAVVSERVSRDFLEVTRLEWIESVAITVGPGSLLGISLTLSNRTRADPEQVLSEAALDLLALLILIEVHIACAAIGQARLIVLDDVFQSVDSTHRIRALDHVLQRLAGWQLVMTLHDRLWLDLVARTMVRANHRQKTLEVVSGSFSSAPTLRGASLNSAVDLELYVNTRASAPTIAGCAGLVLEELCDNLSISLETRIVRRRGDKYTLGDLWPGVSKALRTYGSDIMRDGVEDVSRFLDLRNLIGAHYNEWGLGLALQEAVDFGAATLKLWHACRCAQCGSYFTKFRSTDGRREMYGWPCDCRIASPAGPIVSDDLQAATPDADSTNAVNST